MSSRIIHGTLVANTPTTVTLDSPYESVEVLNRDGTAEIYFRTDGLTPTVGGTDCYVLLASLGGLQTSAATELAGAVTQVILISAGAPKYTVTGLND